MVSISQGSADETDRRLRGVLAAAERVVQPGVWTFVESPLDAPPDLDARPLAVVRDDETWSALVPAGDDTATERFEIVSFHFPAGVDNSGFVGWLASTVKDRLGSGVFVVCGSNASRGGIYDHWGCPEGLLGRVLAVVDVLAGGSRSPLDTSV